MGFLMSRESVLGLLPIVKSLSNKCAVDFLTKSDHTFRDMTVKTQGLLSCYPIGKPFMFPEPGTKE